MFSCATKGYDGTLADIFSLGVLLFVLVMGFYPFDKPNITDPKYKLILKKDFQGFWKKTEQKKLFSNNGSNSNNNFSATSEFKDLFENMICPKPKDRINISQIKKHPWLQEMSNYYGKSEVEEKVEINNSPKTKVIKHLSHNPSFNKEEKKSEGNSENNSDTKSNNSDDLEQKKNKKNSFYLEDNPQNINKNNSLKEFEIKYMKEFASRKINIDKILKEQEDYGD